MLLWVAVGERDRRDEICAFLVQVDEDSRTSVCKAHATKIAPKLDLNLGFKMSKLWYAKTALSDTTWRSLRDNNLILPDSIFVLGSVFKNITMGRAPDVEKRNFCVRALLLSAAASLMPWHSMGIFSVSYFKDEEKRCSGCCRIPSNTCV